MAWLAELVASFRGKWAALEKLAQEAFHQDSEVFWGLPLL
jgi:hypothetical protein